MRFFSRLANLVRGAFTHWLGGRERRNPGAVYEAAIQQRLAQYGKLREAAAGVLYMRSKLAAEVEGKSIALRSLNRQLDIAVERNEDDLALSFIHQKTVLGEDVARLSKELGDLNAEAEAAKKNLIAFRSEVVRLRDEKVRTLARLANARARLRFQETIKGLVPDADIQALEEVRAYVERLAAEVDITREVSDSELEQKLESIRAAEADSAARAQLEELKRAKHRALVPVKIPEGAPINAEAAV
jgi:phage shock protein A